MDLYIGGTRWDRLHRIETVDFYEGGTRWDRPTPLKLLINTQVGRGETVPPQFLWGGTVPPRLWFIKLKRGRGGVQDAGVAISSIVVKPRF
jgi:hypothetical protein